MQDMEAARLFLERLGDEVAEAARCHRTAELAFVDGACLYLHDAPGGLSRGELSSEALLTVHLEPLHLEVQHVRHGPTKAYRMTVLPRLWAKEREEDLQRAMYSVLNTSDRSWVTPEGTACCAILRADAYANKGVDAERYDRIVRQLGELGFQIASPPIDERVVRTTDGLVTISTWADPEVMPSVDLPLGLPMQKVYARAGWSSYLGYDTPSEVRQRLDQVRRMLERFETVRRTCWGLK